MPISRTSPRQSGPRVLRVRGRNVPVGSHEGKLIVMGADHRGYQLKKKLKRFLKRRGWKVRDVGAYSPKRVDYPLVTLNIARAIGRSEGRRAVGIGVCGSGIGMFIVAAKVSGVHPALPRTIAAARQTRTHNNTNFLSLGADVLPTTRAYRITEAWLKESFYTDPEKDQRFLRRHLQTVKLDRLRRRK